MVFTDTCYDNRANKLSALDNCTVDWKGNQVKVYNDIKSEKIGIRNSDLLYSFQVIAVEALELAKETQLHMWRLSAEPNNLKPLCLYNQTRTQSSGGYIGSYKIYDRKVHSGFKLYCILRFRCYSWHVQISLFFHLSAALRLHVTSRLYKLSINLEC